MIWGHVEKIGPWQHIAGGRFAPFTKGALAWKEGKMLSSGTWRDGAPFQDLPFGGGLQVTGQGFEEGTCDFQGMM